MTNILHIKILHLVLFSHSFHYDIMKTITEKYYKKFSNVDTYYYCYDNKLDGIYNNNIYINGKETYIPGILTKTIKTFEKFEKLNNFDYYDYIIRSNISTLVNFDLLLKYLENNNVMYGGGIINNLQWLDEMGGIKDEKYFRTSYVSGTCIIFNKDIMKKLLENKLLLDYDVIDDVALGVLMKKLNINITDIGHYIFCEKDFRNVSKDIIFYRNRNTNRDDDIVNLKFISENI